MALSNFVSRVRSLWRGLVHRGEVEAEMMEEFQHHLELRTEEFIRRGVQPKEAARRARLEFGHLENHREDARASRGLRLFDEIRVSTLDVKLGLRMFMKYPWLSLVSVIGMSVAIAIGAGAFGFIGAFLDPTLPLDEGERVVSIHNADVRNVDNPDRRSLHDFVDWRDELTSVKDLSAFMTDSRNLVVPGGSVQLVRVAQMTASGFRLARVQPVLGRPLLDEDEHPASPPVVVIAYEEWQRRFDADPAIVGREVRLGGAVHIVVGVMPQGFLFPINHRYWVPLRLHAADYERGGGPALFTFGRLAEGVTLREAQAEITTIGRRTAAAYPATHEHLRPRILRYTHDYVDIDSPAIAWGLRALQLAISLLLVVVAVNVAILVYARTATRAGEIAVRTALGASRRRVVTQLVVEALVMSAAAAAIGLTIAGVALAQIQNFWERAPGNQLPFWLDVGLSPGMVVYVVGLAIIGGVIVGVFPALKATGQQVQAGLQRLSSGGSGMQLGRTWTVLIVVQVAIAVAIMPYALYVAGMSIRRGMAEPGYPAEQFLRASLSMEREEAPPAAEADAYNRTFETRFRDRAAELVRRLETEPAVAGVTLATRFPGSEGFGRIEVETARTEIESASGTTVGDQVGRRWVLTNEIDTDLMTVFGIPTLAGRGFREGDGEGSSAVIVDRVFAEQVLGGGSVLGRRLRFVTRTRNAGVEEIQTGPWLEIVGVVPDFTVPNDFEPPNPKVYQPLELPRVTTVLALAVRVRGGSASAFAGRLREITASVDPALQLHELLSASDFQKQTQQGLLGLALVVVAVTASVLLLSAAGIYAMMSFTVTRRRREIGIRTALGADQRRILSGIFARASAQIGAGLAIGLVLAAAIDRSLGGEALGGKGIVLIPLVAALMAVIGLAAALGPARRGLAVQPTEALREE